MILYGGERVTLTSGAPSINSIGVSLGRIARFCGHTRKYYNVLAHSLVVAEQMPSHLAIHGLLHDAPEALVSDVPTPMKTQVARNRERALLERIYIANGIPWPIPEEAVDVVDWADHEALLAEAHVLGHPGAKSQWGDYYSQSFADATKKMLPLIHRMQNPKYSGPLFRERFAHYLDLAYPQLSQAVKV